MLFADCVLADEPVLFCLEVLGDSSSLSILVSLFFCQALVQSISRDSLLILGHRSKETAKLLRVLSFLLCYLISNLLSIDIFEKLGELPNALVEERQQLVCLQAEFILELVNRLELQSHSDEESNLNVGERYSSLRQYLEVQLCDGWNQIHDQVEVN